MIKSDMPEGVDSHVFIFIPDSSKIESDPALLIERRLSLIVNHNHLAVNAKIFEQYDSTIPSIKGRAVLGKFLFERIGQDFSTTFAYLLHGMRVKVPFLVLDPQIQPESDYAQLLFLANILKSEDYLLAGEICLAFTALCDHSKMQIFEPKTRQYFSKSVDIFAALYTCMREANPELPITPNSSE